MSSLRTPAVDLGNVLYEKLYAFALRYIKHPSPLKQYNSTQTLELFEQTFMTLETFQERFAPGYAQEQIKIFNAKIFSDPYGNPGSDMWPRGQTYFPSSSWQRPGPTLSEQICEYVLKLLYPHPSIFGFRSIDHSTDESWYDLFHGRFSSFSFMDEHSQQTLPGGNVRAHILRERVLVQNLIDFLSELPAPTVRKKSSYSIINFRRNDPERGKTYYVTDSPLHF